MSPRRVAVATIGTVSSQSARLATFVCLSNHHDRDRWRHRPNHRRDDDSDDADDVVGDDDDDGAEFWMVLPVG